MPRSHSILCKFHNVSDEGDSGAKDPRAINEAFMKLKVGEFACFYFAVVGMCCGIVEYEISYGSNEQYKTKQIILLSIGTFSTLCLLVSIVVRYILHLKWSQSRGILGKFDTMVNTGYWKYMFFELLFCFIHPLPFLWNINYDESYPDLSTPATVDY